MFAQAGDMSNPRDRESAPPVAFCLHALGASCAEFIHLRDALAGEIDVVALDLPGFGDTPWDDGPSVEHTVEFVIRRIRARGAPRWMLVGHSMGGKIASIVAARTLSGRAPLFGLAGIVLVAASPVTPEPMAEDRRASMIGWAADGHLSEESAREFVDANIAGPLTATDMTRAVADVRRADPLAWRAWLERGSREDWSPEIGALPLPALIVSGAEDGDLGEPAQRLLNGATYRAAQFVTIEGAAHLLPIERPHEVAAAIRTFWHDHAGTSPEVPLGTARVIASERTSARTRGILSRRAVADDPGYEPSVLSVEQLATLRSLAGRLVPQGDDAIDLAARVDQQLLRGAGDGWRNPVMPADPEAYRLGLDALLGFGDQTADRQDETIAQLIDGSFDAEGAALSSEQLQLWFDDARVDLTRQWMAHPATFARVGYDGFGNGGDGVRKQGFALLAAGRREAWEPSEGVIE
jgi:pimeloyl-ACP methyl ester carboxylesterase